MPVRDAAASVAAAVTGVLADPLRDLELLAVDDGSLDDTPQLLAELSRQDARLRVVRQGREGLVAALNRGLSEVRTPLLVRHDADDLSMPGRIRDQVEFLDANPAVSLVATRCRVFREDGLTGDGMRHWAAWSNRLASHEAMYRQRFVESPFAHPAVAVRTETVRRADGYADGDFPEDYELWLRLLARGERFARIPRVGVHVREHPERSIHRDDRYRPQAFRRLKRHHLEREFLLPGQPVVIFGGGRVAKTWMREFLAEGREVAALADLDPRRIGMHIDGVPVVHAREASAGGRLGGLRALGALGRPAARYELRRALPALGRFEGEDFLFVS